MFCFARKFCTYEGARLTTVLPPTAHSRSLYYASEAMKPSTDLKLKKWCSIKDRSIPLHNGITIKVNLKTETLDVVHLHISVAEKARTFQSWPANSKPAEPVETFDGNGEAVQKGSDVVIFSEEVDPILAACFVSSIRRSADFFYQCLKTFSFICQQRKHVRRDIPATCSHIKILIPILPRSNQFSLEADIRWSNRILPLWTNRLIIEDVFSWFSTLGGAYSSLGDYHSSCAIQAGFLSLKQLKLAWTLGDPFLQSRCLIYLSQSLMQRGFFKLARKIIRKQYEFAVTSKPYDHRLTAMCEGVWTRLEYSQWKRKADKGMDTKFKIVTLSQSTVKREGHSNGHIKGAQVTH